MRVHKAVLVFIVVQVVAALQDRGVEVFGVDSFSLSFAFLTDLPCSSVLVPPSSAFAGAELEWWEEADPEVLVTGSIRDSFLHREQRREGAVHRVEV